MVRVRESRRWLRCTRTHTHTHTHTHVHTQRWRPGSSVNLFFLRSAFWVEISRIILYSGRPCKISWSYLLQPATYPLHVATSPFSMTPTKCTWSRFLLACHPRNLWGISTGDKCIVITLGTRCISFYFVPRIRFPQLNQLIERGLQVNIQHKLRYIVITLINSYRLK